MTTFLPGFRFYQVGTVGAYSMGEPGNVNPETKERDMSNNNAVKWADYATVTEPTLIEINRGDWECLTDSDLTDEQEDEIVDFAKKYGIELAFIRSEVGPYDREQQQKLEELVVFWLRDCENSASSDARFTVLKDDIVDVLEAFPSDARFTD